MWFFGASDWASIAVVLSNPRDTIIGTNVAVPSCRFKQTMTVVFNNDMSKSEDHLEKFC